MGAVVSDRADSIAGEVAQERDIRCKKSQSEYTPAVSRLPIQRRRDDEGRQTFEPQQHAYSASHAVIRRGRNPIGNHFNLRGSRRLWPSAPRKESGTQAT